MLQGDSVSVHYDPMISKLICHAETRDLAIDKLVASLKEYQVVGVPTNVEFAARCADHEAFRAGGVDTGFLDTYGSDVRVEENRAGSEVARALAAAALIGSGGGRGGRGGGAFGRLSNFRVHGAAEVEFNFAGVVSTVVLGQENRGPSGTSPSGTSTQGTFTIADRETGTSTLAVKYAFDIKSKELSAWVGGKRFLATAVVTASNNGDRNVSLWSKEAGKTFDGEEEFYASITAEMPGDAAGGAEGGEGGEGAGVNTVASPMPGKIAALNVRAGDAVEAGDIVMVLEAMKMEHPIASPVAGTVADLAGDVGDLVADGQPLFAVERGREGGGGEEA